jgi:hypothetical protein
MQYPNVLVTFLTPLIAFVLALNANAEDIRLKEFYKMAPNIQTVKQVCPWKSSSTKGVIRLMQVEDKGAHRLYVQWLRHGIAGGPQLAISTIGISEINDDGYYRYDLPDGQLLAGACLIETIMEDIVDERRFRLTLYLTGPGKYELHMTRLLDASLQ